MKTPMIELVGVTKRFPNGTIALQNLDLCIQAGEFVSILGPSGCGKSTVLGLAAGLGAATAGQVIRAVAGDRRGNLAQAFVFQDAALLPWATVRDNVRLPLKLAGVPGAECDRAASEAIARVGLQGYERAYPRQLSGGMKMRVSIARALTTDPQVMLMDEPFGALDEITRSRLNDQLLELWWQKRWTTLFVTHNSYEAVFLSTRVVVMAAQPGRIVAEVKIDAPYPRTESFRRSREFADYRYELAQHLAAGSRSPGDSDRAGIPDVEEMTP